MQSSRIILDCKVEQVWRVNVMDLRHIQVVQDSTDNLWSVKEEERWETYGDKFIARIPSRGKLTASSNRIGIAAWRLRILGGCERAMCVTFAVAYSRTFALERHDIKFMHGEPSVLLSRRSRTYDLVKR